MDEEDSSPLPGKPSRTPSWVMLGFVLGALFVIALPRRAPGPPPEAPAKPAPSRAAPPAPRLTTIEAVFAAWGKYAVWDNDVTEVALWDPEAKGFTDCFEVMRLGDTLYFRSIPRLTRPVLTHGVTGDSPLQFTETEAQRQVWLRARVDENWRGLSQPTPALAPSKG